MMAELFFKTGDIITAKNLRNNCNTYWFKWMSGYRYYHINDKGMILEIDDKFMKIFWFRIKEITIVKKLKLMNISNF